MNKQKPYIFIIDVTARSPKGVKALNSKLRGVGIADVPNARFVLEQRAIEQVKLAYQEKYPGVPMQFSARSTRIEQQFLIVEGLEAEPEPTTPNEKQDEQTEK